MLNPFSTSSHKRCYWSKNRKQSHRSMTYHRIHTSGHCWDGPSLTAARFPPWLHLCMNVDGYKQNNVMHHKAYNQQWTLGRLISDYASMRYLFKLPFSVFIIKHGSNWKQQFFNSDNFKFYFSSNTKYLLLS